MYIAGEQPIEGIEQDWGALDTLRVPENTLAHRLELVQSLGGIVTNWDVILPPFELQELDMQAIRERLDNPDTENLLDLIPTIPGKFLDRISVNSDSGCWELPIKKGTYKGAKYPLITSKELGAKAEGAHRVFYRQLVGEIKEGGFIDHRCLNKACVYPRHVQDVTPAVNTRRGHIDNMAKYQLGLIIEA